MTWLKTRLCKLLAIRYPIVQAPMDWIASPELAAAVSNAGGLGVLARASGAETLRRRAYSLEGLRFAVRELKALTTKPFAVGNIVEPEWMDMLVEEGVRVVITAQGHPGPSTRFYKQHGVTVLHMGASVRHAQIAEAAGVDAFILAGFEAGGHDPGGNDRITTFAGIPQVADAIQIPVIAAGGVGDGRGLVAALALGASGVRVGTRFVATLESSAHPNHKQKIVKANDTSTVYRGSSWKDSLRSLKTPYVVGLVEMENAGRSQAEISAYVGGPSIVDGTLERRLIGEVDGDLQRGEAHAGQIAGLITSIEPAGRVVERIVQEAEAVLGRLVASRT